VSRKRTSQFDDPGQDSFLDIVANLVGILIILVMIVGVRAKDAMVQSKTIEATPVKDDSSRRTAVAIAQQTAVNLEANIGELDQKVELASRSVAMYEQQRQQIDLLTVQLKKQLDEQSQNLAAVDRDRLAQQAEALRLQQQLEDISRRRTAMQSAGRPQNKLEHIPTPLAKAVFNKEVHFRLLNGRLAFVPLDELQERLKAEAPRKVWKLRDADEFTEVIGPVDGFRMRYTLRKSRKIQNTSQGPVSQTRAELKSFTLASVSDRLGEPLEEALQDSSQLSNRLADLDPNRVTITVWVYPESFRGFRTLKRYLFERGFRTASRPLPAGEPIQGSPNGSRSVAQ